MKAFVIVFLGAGIGGAMRHGINWLAARFLSGSFPYHTLTENVLGSFVLGLLVGWFAHKAEPGQSWQLFLTTGLMGGFTTFSTFSLEVNLLYDRGEAGMAAVYLLLSVALSVLGLFGGIALARHVA